MRASDISTDLTPVAGLSSTRSSAEELPLLNNPATFTLVASGAHTRKVTPWFPPLYRE